VTEVRSYYGRPVLKPPVWEPTIALYLFTGGLAGGSAALAAAARGRGNHRLARRSLLTALGGLALSPPLLISDLGRRDRFHHMLRVLKPTSPMSVGTWILSATGALTGVAAGSDLLGVVPRTGRAAERLAGLLGPALSTYTAVLLADTAVPAWHEARFELPFLFAASSAASAAGAALVLTPPEDAGPARALCLGGAVAEIAVAQLMERRLGALAAPSRRRPWSRLAAALSGGGAALVAVAGRRRPAAAVGGLAVVAGAVTERWSVYTAGRDSAADPAATIAPQRARLGGGHSAAGWRSRSAGERDMEAPGRETVRE
jgi:Polysulfide reductase